MFLSKMAHCGGREGQLLEHALCSLLPLHEGKKNLFPQSGGWLMWSGPNEYLLTHSKEYPPGFHFKN